MVTLFRNYSVLFMKFAIRAILPTANLFKILFESKFQNQMYFYKKKKNLVHFYII